MASPVIIDFCALDFDKRNSIVTIQCVSQRRFDSDFTFDITFLEYSTAFFSPGLNEQTSSIRPAFENVDVSPKRSSDLTEINFQSKTWMTLSSLQETSGLVFAGRDLFNPYHHFGQSSMWPRGYPLSKIGDVSKRTYWLSSRWTTPTIQQGIVNGDPDMDAIFRLTRKSVTAPINVTFDPHAPPVILPQGVFCPFNSQNTLFHERAFWAMLIPTGTTFRMCDIWRGYWAQRLMWEIGDRLAFFPANAYQNRSAHSYLDDAKDEKDMYFQTESLIAFLTSWTCPAILSFFDCILELTTAMVDQNFWRHEETQLTRFWLEDLLDLGYTEPARVREVAILTETKIVITEQFNQLHEVMDKKDTRQSKVIFVPVEQELQIINNPNISKSILTKSFESISEICPNITSEPFSIVKHPYLNYYNDILVIIIFNTPTHYSNVVYIHTLYSNIFPNIIYCGDDATNFMEESKSLGKQVSFIEASIKRGELGYLCTIKALELKLRVKGYLILGDDIMFKHWAFSNTSKDHFWVQEGSTLLNFTNTIHSWYWWKLPIGKSAFEKTMSDLMNARNVPQYINTTNFIDNLSNFTGSPEIIEVASSDIYYIPASRQMETCWYLKKFHDNRSFLEVAVPTVVRGLETRTDLVLIKGKSLWNEDRNNPFRIYSKVQHYVHPMKISDKQTRKGICEMFLPDILSKNFGIKFSKTP